MRRLPIYLSLLFLVTCAKEDSQAPNTSPSQITSQYTLTATAGDGGSVSTAGGTFSQGTQVSITATPNAGYSFSSWSDGSTANPLTVTLNSNTSVSANFELITVVLDSDGDGIADLEDAWPYDASMSENLWGVINDGDMEFFFAADVSENISQGTRDSFLEAIDEFGNWGPTELWVLGQDIDAANELSELYCQRRLERGQQTFSPGFNYTSCLVKMMYPNHNVETNAIPSFILNSPNFIGDFEYYREKSVMSVENNLGTGWGKGLNGNREWGFKIFTFSLPVGFSEEGYNYDYEKVNLFYEYFHALQESAFPIDENNGNTYEFGEDTQKGPHWFYSGASTYYAEYAVRKRNPNHNLNSLKERIEQQFGYAMCEGIKLSDLTPDSDCFLMKFYWGMPAIAYLLNRVNNQNAIVETFYPNIYELGFQGAFELTFGFSVQEFYNEWEVYLNLPMEERLEIIPDI